MKKIRNTLSVLIVAALLLTCACAFAESSKGLTTVTVSTVDEFLAAIAPDTQIVMQQGFYDLKTAEEYGRGSSEYYRWGDVYDGYELVIFGADNLTISAAKDADVIISAVPRYANVLSFENMSGLTLRDVTCGHTKEPGVCAGGVLKLYALRNTLIDDCKLYGCGIIGVDAYQCSELNVNDCDIYECSQNAVSTNGCFDVRVNDCDIYKCSCEWGSIFSVSSTTGFAVVNSEIEDNSAQFMLYCSFSPETYMLGCETENNYFSDAMFYIAGKAPVIADCGLCKNNFTAWYDSSTSPTPGVKCLDREENELTNMQLEDMSQKDCSYDGPTMPEKISVEYTEDEDGRRTATVKTADEFLAAIASNVNIRIEECEIDLSSASDYGSGANEYYYWRSCYDGAELVIRNAEDLSITSETMALISAVPRYANVLNFEGCSGLWLSGFTAGHTAAEGECSGGVLNFDGCASVTVDGCKLFGCGILGVSSNCVDGLTVQGTEIYDCSYGAVSLNDTHDTVFTDNSIRNCPQPEISLYGSGARFENAKGKSKYIEEGLYTLNGSGLPVPWSAEDYVGDAPESLGDPEILVVCDNKVIDYVLAEKDGEPVTLTANVIMPDNSRGDSGQILWMSSENEQGYTLDTITGDTVHLSSTLEKDDYSELYVFYFENGTVLAQTTILVVGK